MRYDPIPPQLFTRNRERLQAKLPPGSIAILVANDVMPLSADGTMRFYQDSDLFWLTGVDQEETVLILTPQEQILFVRETSDEIRIWEGDRLSRDQAVQASGVQNVQWTDKFEQEFRRLMKTASTVFLNANEHARAARDVETRADRFRVRCQSLYPQHFYDRLGPILHELRVRKSEEEIAILKRACAITREGFLRLLSFVRPGVKEYEIEGELLHEFLRHGSKGFAYTPIIASGEGSCVLHYISNDATCRDGQVLLLDVAAEYARYNSDLTRTIPVNGRFTDRQKAVYNAVLRVLRACIDHLLRPGVEVKAYQKEVGKIMEKELLGLGLLDPKAVAEERAKDGTDEEVKEEKRLYRKYFMHGTSHSLGLDVHDVSPADRIVREDSVYTVEPGIYIREEGFGVRLENDVWVRAGGNVDLMADIPIEADEIEALMAQPSRAPHG